jgi:tRNA nucleotidyltransferase (CCA-adding enzyme)
MIAILAHRQMDFDALASMVAAQKLYPDSVMIADGKSNPYVQDFIALAKDRLPFKRLQDIDWAGVEKIVLVDTHDLHRAAGLKDNQLLERIPLEVFDHHPYDGEIKPGMTIQNLGACTTMLVEKLMDLGIPLSSFEATLFTLGIYDDTGSLLFESTTVRDVQVVANLLKEGANLGVVAEYLRKPLTEEQKELLQQLFERGETHLFDGLPIYISSAFSDDYVGGLALLAHRVGEVEGAETLFLVVQMENRVYLIGRSRGRGLPVNRIVQAFGGAGHPRAASATLKNAVLDEIIVRLRHEIGLHVQSPNLVRDIMSFPVKSVSPEMKLSEVEQILLKYGHTGVPVAQDGLLVGIISRRDVEKALKHGLEHAPVKGFMTKEVITVESSASWEEVQRIMVQNDIGRVPVLEEGKIVGIVSRSDILRLVHGSAVPTEAALMRDRAIAMRQDILQLLQELPEEILHLLNSVQQIGDKLGHSVYVVGGFVRDLLLKVPTQDLDFVVEGDGHAFAKELFETLNEGQLILHNQFGTARIEFPDGAHLDVAKSRWEYYAFPGALPQVEESRLRDDMFRRDFTINAMAIAINSNRYGELVDYYGGLRDLKQGEIRFLHNLSFIEDPTRILRAIRFAGRYRFHITKETREGVNTALKSGILQKLSTERFTEEIILLLREKNFGKMGEILLELEVLKEWYGADLPWDFSHALLNDTIALEKKWLIALRKMKPFEIETVLSQLRLTKELRLITSKFSEVLSELTSLKISFKLSTNENTQSLSALDSLLDSVPSLILDVLLLDEDLRPSIEGYRKAVEKIRNTLTGADLIHLGVKEGPEVGRILREIRFAWLKGIVHTPEEEREFVLHYLKDFSNE